ncbi:FAD/NAD P-binding domain-containing protein [Mycena indigotica]|uniref:FAD/NAD P-binding domain-containing protein n=1 Tax=Mycena indigotica TaxID=2126181 RepID=A0A8H6SD83_9AGAR|nr:FAD/NAD P-binding domain-containing protein [Mycena indigotica]KAF7297289.1 FAD/NAD P-binding domain-containing protein [Mycena indigotica]
MCSRIENLVAEKVEKANCSNSTSDKLLANLLLFTQMIQVPSFSQVLVIGGGPGGSYAATVLAREGFEVTLLERDIFPRYHIGESLLPSVRPFLRFIGAEDVVKNHGFAEKPGAAVKLNQHKREGYTDFISLNPENGAWNVVRSEFDELLLRHAAASGVTVREGVKVKEIGFTHGAPVSAQWESKTGESGSINFGYLVDASGRHGIMSTRYLQNRHINKSLRNQAAWGYWRGTNMYAPENLPDRKNAPWFEALTDETGWCWFIPLHNKTVSVGVVLTEEASIAKKRANKDGSLKDHYLEQLKLAPGLIRLLGDGNLVSEVKSAGDYSYSATHYAGPRYRLVGDAAAFIDPLVFSSGVHLAFTGALSAASSIAASIKRQCSETEAIAFHNAKVGTSYTRFLLVVLGIYKQIKAQESPVLSDVDSDNFDQAFVFLRPIIQGAADADPELTEKELQDTMDFCANVFAPTNPLMHTQVAEKYGSGSSMLSPTAAIMSVDAIMKLAGNDEDAKHVLLEVNARKAIHTMYDADTNFATEIMGGFCVRMQQGNLGLVRV